MGVSNKTGPSVARESPHNEPHSLYSRGPVAMVATASKAGNADASFFPGALVTLESQSAQLCRIGPA